MKQANKDRTKRVLIIMPNLNAGGAEKVIAETINHIDKTKFKLVLYLFHDVGVLKECLPKNTEIVAALDPGQHLRLHLPKAIFRLWREAVKADLIVGGLELVPTYFAVIGKILTRKPAIGWVHSVLQEYPPAKVKHHRVLCRWLYPLLSHTVTVSNGVRRELLDLLPLEPQKVTTIYNPVDVERIGFLAEEPVEYESNWPLALAVGRLGRQKGFDVLIKAHSMLMRKGIKHNLVILGEGEKRQELERIIQEYGVEDSVYLPGFQKNPYLLFFLAYMGCSFISLFFVLGNDEKFSDLSGFVLASNFFLAAWLGIQTKYSHGNYSNIYTLRYVFCLSFSLSVLLSIVNVFYFWPDTLYPDEFRYQQVGHYIVQAIQNGALPDVNRIVYIEGSPNIGNGLLHGLLFLFFPGSLAVNALNSVLLLATGVTVYKYVELTEKNVRVAKTAAILTILSPSMLHWSAVSLKEAMIAFLVVMFIYYLERIHKQPRNVITVLMILSVLSVYRIYIGIISIAIFIIAYKWPRKLPREKKVVFSLLGIGVMIAAMYGILRFWVHPANILTNLQYAKDYGAHYLLEQGYFLGNYLQDSIKSYLVRIVTFFLTPNPFNALDVKAPSWYLASLPWYLGNMMWLFLLPFSFYGMAISIKTKKHLPAFILICIVVLFFSYMPQFIDARRRASLMPLLYIFSAIGISKSSGDMVILFVYLSFLLYIGLALVYF